MDEVLCLFLNYGHLFHFQMDQIVFIPQTIQWFKAAGHSPKPITPPTPFILAVIFLHVYILLIQTYDFLLHFSESSLESVIALYAELWSNLSLWKKI